MIKEGVIYVKKNHRWKKYKFHLDEGCIFRVKSNGQERVISLFLGSVKATQIKEKDGGKVAYGFEIITPSATTSFYVESEEERTAWIESIQNVCNRMTITSIVDGVPDKVIESPDTANHEEIREELRKLLQEEGNNKCADCNSSDTHWACINLGIFICIKCSGVHRRLGTHISKVRSVDLDVWDSETLEHMKEVGNLKSNAIYEYSVPPQYTKPTEDSDDILRERWIFAKYQRRRFCADYIATSPMLPTIPSGSSISSPYSLSLNHNSTPISPLANNPHIVHRRSRSSTAPETNPLTKPLRPSMTVTLSPPQTTYLTLPKSPRHSSHVPVSPRSRSPSPTPTPTLSLHSSLMASYPPNRPATKTTTPEPNTPHPVKDYPNNESLQLLKDSILQLLRNDKSFRDEVREILAQDK